MNEDTGVWAYAITEDGHSPGPDGEVDLSWVAGVGAAKVRTITCSGLTVLVSDVRRAEFGEAALRENLENLDWLDEVAREHHHVIDAAARLFPLLPVRLATVYSGDAAVCAALAEHNGRLLNVLRRVGGRIEWGVKVYAAQEPEAAPESGTAEPDKAGSAPAARNLAAGAGTGEDAGPGSGAGLAYLKRRRAQLTEAREAKVSAVNAAQAVHADLTAKAADTRLHPPQSAQLSGVRQPMLLNAAYLLDPSDAATFTAAVAGQATAHPELRVELTGPWPPYSFADGDDDRH
jgi:pyruvate/2-oxoglutarate dehydrogenase complex dihydrolipoamide acyltransferase (E2) component